MGLILEDEKMKRTAPILIVIMMIMSGFILMDPMNEDAEGNLLNDAILTARSPIEIKGDLDFTSANGVSSGSGTGSDPYIIENWRISARSSNGISISQTTAHFVVRNCHIIDGYNPEKDDHFEGIVIWTVKNGTLVNCMLEQNWVGISVGDSIGTIIRSNTCIGNGREGIKNYLST